VSITAGLAAALVASIGNAKSAGGIVLSALRAEVVKLGLAVLLLWIVLVNYAERWSASSSERSSSRC